MFRRYSDSENFGDHNWRRLWETPNRKSQRRYARVWVHQLPSDLPLHEVLVVPAHPTGSSEFVTMSSNPANQPITDPFLRWRQEMEVKQEEQARQMTELCEHANHLQQENECLWARLETNMVENPQGACHAPNLEPTQLADLNRFPGRETTYWDSLPDFFFLKPYWYLWVWPTSYNRIQISYTYQRLPPEWCPSKSRHL